MARNDTARYHHADRVHQSAYGPAVILYDDCDDPDCSLVHHTTRTDHDRSTLPVNY